MRKSSNCRLNKRHKITKNGLLSKHSVVTISMFTILSHKLRFVGRVRMLMWVIFKMFEVAKCKQLNPFTLFQRKLMQESNSTILSLWQVAFLRGPFKDLKAKFNSIINFFLSLVTYRKIPKISPGSYISVSKALFKGLIF